MSHLEEGMLHALLDGEIPSAELAPIQAHLAACAACRARLEEERQLLGDADGLVGALEVPATGTTVVRPASRTPRFALGRSLAWAASLVLALGTGWLARGRQAPTAGVDVVAARPAESTVLATAQDPPPKTAAETAALPDPAASPAGRTATRGAGAPRRDRAGTDSMEAGKATALVAERKQERVAAAAADAAPPPLARQPQPSAPPAAAGAVQSEPAREEFRAMQERSANAALSLRAAGARLAPAEPLEFPDAIRRLGGSLRLIEGLVPLRLESQGPFVRVIYAVTQGELVLQQQLVDGRVTFTLTGPPGFPADSLGRLRARVRE